MAESLEEFGLRPIEHLAGLRRARARGDRRARHARLAAASSTCSRETGSTVCACPTTEANLGDGFLPAAELWERGVPVSFGADSNVRLDPFEEARETEGCARRQSGRRNVLVAEGDAGPRRRSGAASPTTARAASGSRRPGIAAGAPADLVALDLEHPEIRGVAPRAPRRRRALQRHGRARARDLGRRLRRRR